MSKFDLKNPFCALNFQVRKSATVSKYQEVNSLQLLFMQRGSKWPLRGCRGQKRPKNSKIVKKCAKIGPLNSIYSKSTWPILLRLVSKESWDLANSKNGLGFVFASSLGPKGPKKAKKFFKISNRFWVAKFDGLWRPDRWGYRVWP